MDQPGHRQLHVVGVGASSSAAVCSAWSSWLTCACGLSGTSDRPWPGRRRARPREPGPGGGGIAAILPRSSYRGRPCPGPRRPAAPGRRRWSPSDAASVTTGARSSPSARGAHRRAGPPPGSTISATPGGRSPSRACAPRSTTRPTCICRAASDTRRAPAYPPEPSAHGRPVGPRAPRLEQPVPAPIVVTGLSRSGTTFLHELLACDPDNRPPLLWELLHTVPYDEASGDLCDQEIKLMDEMIPSFTAMHENGGRLPTECIFAFAHQFRPTCTPGPQRPGLHDLEKRGRPGPDLRLARAIYRHCSGSPSGRRHGGSSRRPPISLLCLCSSRPTRTPGSSSPTATRCVSSGRWPT